MNHYQYRIRPSILLLLSVFVFLHTIHAVASEPTPDIPEIWSPRQAVSFALANSPDVRISKQRLHAARADITKARAAFYPTLNVGAEYNRTNNPMYSFGNILNHGVFDNTIDFNDPGTTDSFSLTADLIQRFYSGGRIRAGLKASQAKETAARFELAALHSTLAFEVIRAFYSIVQAEEIVQADQSAIEAIESSLKVGRAKYEAGSLLKLDLLDLELQKSVARENLIKARHDLDLAEKRFINLLGLESDTAVIDPALDADFHKPTELSPDKRAELKSLDALINASTAGVRAAESGKYPTVDAVAHYQLEKGFAMEGDGNSWAAGVKLGYNIFDGGRTGAAVAGAKALLLEAMEQKRKISLAITLEVQQAELAVEQANERLTVTEQMVNQAMESARLSRERFQEGVLLASDLVDVENRLTDARVRRTVARAAYRIAVADLRRAVGLAQF